MEMTYEHIMLDVTNIVIIHEYYIITWTTQQIQANRMTGDSNSGGDSGDGNNNTDWISII